ncbi:hypothetical protein ORG41_04025 [[Curtobacterium] plantarum]|uniref:hypothetical protein n=1 Tax=[Curtobacterium] plantarum TaxID=221276 RepID=UPI00224B29CC|nr:hypothetical protein [[Curtobacterium] plantarum]MCX2905141.1 hypothetical protein [[Curtobacterium] plantarum]
MKILKKTHIIIALFTASPLYAKENPELTGETITRSVDLIFRAESKLDLQIIPVKNLRAQLYADKTKVAIIKVSSTQPYQLGIRFTPGSGEINYAGLIKLKGKSQPTNTLSLGLHVDGHYTTQDNWAISADNITSLSGQIQINGVQNVPADIYTLSMDASAFIS